MFYNLYIEYRSKERIYKIALNNEQINRIVDAYLNGEFELMIKGSLTQLRDVEKFIIYSIDENKLSGKQEEIESYLNKSKNFTATGKITLSFYKQFGTNITDKLTNGLNWGSRKLENIPKKTSIEYSKGKIFISHASANASIAQMFTENLLQLVLNIQPERIFNISIENCGINTGEKFLERIQGELTSAAVVILIITEEYKRSEVCMNEMGAAWALNKRVIPFILPPINFENVGFIHRPNQMLKINEASNLLRFVSENKGILFDHDYDDQKLSRKIDEFLLKLSENGPSKKIAPPRTITASKKKCFKINNHANYYLQENNVYREVPDKYTLNFYGINDESEITALTIEETEMKRSIGQPLLSVKSGQLVSIKGQSKVWLVINDKRHLILNDKTLIILRGNGTDKKRITGVEQNEISAIPQGDSVDFSNL
ncbi:MAG: toll/interleukin-1 receptor domain-containing protein [Bacteroidia bacterium]|nr:toll/interleukin-1 receptor domain-containing protein [Bacteroidia bacterium]